MTHPIILPIVVALLGPAEAEEPLENPFGPSGEATSPEGEEPADVAPEPEVEEPLEAAPPGPDPAFESSTEPPAEDAPSQPLPVGSTAGAEAPETPPGVVAPQPAPPPAARPIRWRLDFGLGGAGTVVGDVGFRAFSDDRSLFELTVSSVFDFRLAQGRVFLGGGLAYQRASRDGDAYGSQVDTDLRLHEPQVLGRVSVMAVEGIDAFGQVGVGPSFASLAAHSQQTAEQRHVLPRVDGLGGLSLYLPKKWLPRKQASRVTGGIQLGAGYTWRGVIEVQPELVQDEDPLRATTSPWGDLSLHGFSWRVGLFLRVM